MSGGDSELTPGNQITTEQGQEKDIVAFNEANIKSTFDATKGTIKSNLDDFPKKLRKDRQGRHIPGNENYNPEKSELTISMSEAETLLKAYGGHGSNIGNNKERVNFERVIGYYKDPLTGKKIPTTMGIIHYSKNGAHIVPARPKEG